MMRGNNQGEEIESEDVRISYSREERVSESSQKRDGENGYRVELVIREEREREGKIEIDGVGLGV